MPVTAPGLAFYVAGANGGLFRHKVGAALVTVRRSGGSSALDCLNHYLAYSEMLVATSNYWNIVHGRLPGCASDGRFWGRRGGIRDSSAR